jgi:hypothetical protein
MEPNDLLERLLPLAERCLTLWELYINRKYPPPPAAIEGTVWKKGDPLREPQNKAEYEAFPSDQPGRFSRAISAARADLDKG